MTTRTQAFWDAARTITAGQNFGILELVCVHYVQNKTHLATPLVDSINAFSINSRIDTQRRRLGRT